MNRIIHGDCTDVLRTLERGSISACVTDPPYHLTNNTGSRSPYPGQYTPIGDPRSPKGGFMGKQWDGGDIAFRPETWRLVFDALLPGAYLVAFGGTRTYHRTACAIEDAGFEIRDTLCWLYGSGFPKSHDVSKGIDKAAGAEREVVGMRPDHVISDKWREAEGRDDRPESILNITAPATPDAIRWQGWGTALKPAFEPIILARKPLIGTVVANVLQHGTGALNIDACRVATSAPRPLIEDARRGTEGIGFQCGSRSAGTTTQARWPANVLHDGSEEVEAAFAAFGESSSKIGRRGNLADIRGGRFNSAEAQIDGTDTVRGHQDSGSASRFFYSSKADKGDRADSRHPTVKPVDLMRWLVRLVTPPGGTILDPFAGSGTTGEAAMLEGFDCIMIERDPQSVADIRHRIKRWSGEDTPLFAEVAAE